MQPKLYTCCKLAVLLLCSFLFSLRAYTQNCTPATLAGGTTSGPNTVCPGSTVTLGANGGSTGSGISYQWESSADNISWSVITNATGEYFFAGPEVATYYRRKIMCSGSSAYSTAKLVTVNNFNTCYCTPQGGNCSNGYTITNVNFGTINNSSGCSPNGYVNYGTSVAAPSIVTGQYVPVTVTVSTGAANRYVHCYVDFNQTGSFETKEYTLLTWATGNVYNGLIKVPYNCKTGTTRMRVQFNAKADNGYICEQYGVGAESEDYSVNVTANSGTTNGYVIYVKQPATGSDNTGRSWSNALTSVRRALEIATSGDTIKVAKGIYYTGSSPNNTNGYTLQDSVVMLAGYPNTGSPTDGERNVATNPTILSGYQSSNGSVVNYHILYASGAMPSCMVDGFILENGGYITSNSTISEKRGGGISAENGANPTIKNCVIRKSYPGIPGAAIAIYQASPIFQNCIVENNKVYYSCIQVEKNSRPIFYNLLIANNESQGRLVNIDSSNVTFKSSTIATNTIIAAGEKYIINTVNQSRINISNSITYYNPIYDPSYRIHIYDSADVTLNNSIAFLSNCLTQVNNRGTNSLIGFPPKFKDTSNVAGADGLYFTFDDGFALTNPCSPVINKGDNSLAAGIATDITGSPRIFEGVTDIGAYEMQQNKTVIPATVYVNAAATGGNNGTSWANAFTDLNKALQTCSDTVKIAAGTYNPYLSSTEPFWLENKRIILGAYPATGNPTNANRNYGIHITAFTSAVTSMNYAYQVVRGISLDSTSTMDGITFSNITNSQFGYAKTGMVYYTNSNDPVISNCFFTGNSRLNFCGKINRNLLFLNCNFHNNVLPVTPSISENLNLINIENCVATTFKNCSFRNNMLEMSTSIVGEFGKIFNIYKSNPVFDSCSFQRNRSNIFYNVYSNPVVTNCRFLNNYTGYNATDVKNEYSSPTFSKCTFRDSAWADTDHILSMYGGIMSNKISNPVFTDCQFYNGQVSRYGGMAYNDSSLAAFTNCIISSCKNAIYNTNSSNIILNNCIGINNEYVPSYNTGSFMSNSRSSPVLNNCTIVNNSSRAFGAVFNDNASFPQINNSIFWKNFRETFFDTVNLYTRGDVWTPVIGQVSARNSIFEFTNAGTANANTKMVDPRFINITNPIGPDSIWFTADDGLRLCNCSPAINTANNVYAPNATDITNQPRLFGTTVDRGAYELQSVPPANVPFSYYVNASATGSNNGLTWNDAYPNLQTAVNNACADTIRIAAGIYKPAVQNRDSVFYINRSVLLIGSYNAANPNAVRDVDANPSILSGNIGNLADSSDNSKGLITAFYADTVKLDGIVLREAINNVFVSNFGSALAALNANNVRSLDVHNCRFYKNVNANSGGAAFLGFIDRVNIRKTVFSQNRSSSSGGGLLLIRSGLSRKLTDCIFDKNTANAGGGLHYSTGASNGSDAGVSLTNCLFNANLANFGAGIDFDINPDILLTNCTFSNNRGLSDYENRGIGIYGRGSGIGPYISNCIFTGNITVNQTTVQNVYQDTYVAGGPNTSYGTTSLRIHHSIISTMPALDWGGGNLYPYAATVRYKSVGNAIGADGKWLTTDDGLGLSICSGGIDAGLNSANTNLTELSGRSRIYNNIIDMGAYEFSGTPEGAKLLNTANDSLIANKEVTDTDGWTHYYKDCFYLMSLQKRGQNIGTVGNGSFSVKVKTTPAYGSGSATNLSAATYLGPCVVSWKTMNRYWTVTPTNQPTDSIQVRFPYTYTDFNDVRGSNPSITTPQQMVFYKTDGAYNPIGVNIPASNFYKYVNAINPSTNKWAHTISDSTLQASYFVKSFGGGGGGAFILNTPTNVWLGITADWNLAGNWSTGQVPSACSSVIVNAGVPFMPVVTSAASTCYGLTLTNGAIITVSSGGNLTIVGNE